MSSSGEGVRRHNVNILDTGSQVEGKQKTCLFNNGEKVIYSQHPGILIH